jgi:hypothetical protein
MVCRLLAGKGYRMVAAKTRQMQTAYGWANCQALNDFCT